MPRDAEVWYTDPAVEGGEPDVIRVDKVELDPDGAIILS